MWICVAGNSIVSFDGDRNLIPEDERREKIIGVEPVSHVAVDIIINIRNQIN